VPRVCAELTKERERREQAENDALCAGVRLETTGAAIDPVETLSSGCRPDTCQERA